MEDILEGCKKGDRKSQQQLYQRYYGKMMGACLRYAKNEDDAKDVLQEGFIKVFDKISGYSGTGSLEGWIRRIIVNTAIDAYRKSKRTMMIVDTDFVDSVKLVDEEEEEDSDELDFTVEDVMREMQNLSPAYRMVFNMYVVENYTHKEIAEKLGISEGTSKSNFSKAKKNIRKALLQI